MSVIATAGHVDHGKSSLIRALTGTDPDRLAEEQRKGMTIDLGFAHVRTDSGATLSFIDVPGHTDFIRTMISGVSGVDVALLVIDAGEGWKPQTEEHLGILEVLGVTHGVIALSKCDRVDATERQLRIADIQQRITSSTITWTHIVETSTFTGEGLAHLVEALTALTHFSQRTTRPDASRLFIDRIFTMKGSGTVVTGTLDTAPLRLDHKLIVARTNESVRVRDIQVHGIAVDVCEPGTRCAVNLVGVETDTLMRGDALVTPDKWRTTTVCDALIHTLPSLVRPLTHRGSFTVHIGTDFQSTTVRLIGTDEIGTASHGKIRLRWQRPLPLAPGDRFLLRDTSTNSTIGGGVILDIDPQLRLSRAQPDGTVESIMNGRGFVSVEDAELLTGASLAPVVGQWFALPHVVESALQTLTDQLDARGEIDLAPLAPYERELITLLPNVVVSAGIARRRDADALSAHPLAQQIRNDGLTGPSSAQFDRNVVRQLVQQGVVFEHDAVAFHRDTLESLRPELEKLWQVSPEGFTVSQLRDALGITRKHAVPLAECVDKYGLTRRAGDVRIRGHRW
jgi:selenocysteine-specific elongation factor